MVKENAVKHHTQLFLFHVVVSSSTWMARLSVHLLSSELGLLNCFLTGKSK